MKAALAALRCPKCNEDLVPDLIAWFCPVCGKTPRDYEKAKRLGLEPGKARIGLHACRGLAALSGFIILTACKVYLPACQPSEDPPVGVTVHRVDGVNGFELADLDGGADE